MMITLPLSLVVVHFVADFLLQSDWMALNKSKAWKPLLAHTTVYSVCFLPWGWKFALITWVLHTATDYVTSRATSKLWFIDLVEAGKKWRELHRDPDGGTVSQEETAYYVDVKPTRHWFFVVIGLDQLIHYVTLAWTLKLVIG